MKSCKYSKGDCKLIRIYRKATHETKHKDEACQGSVVYSDIGVSVKNSIHFAGLNKDHKETTRSRPNQELEEKPEVIGANASVEPSCLNCTAVVIHVHDACLAHRTVMSVGRLEVPTDIAETSSQLIGILGYIRVNVSRTTRISEHGFQVSYEDGTKQH